jgi:hypothetical protein
MGVAAWSVIDEGYLRAYQWAGALAAGTPLPQEAATMPLGPGEVAHLTLPATAVSGYFGENKPYNRSFLLVGGPVGLALTGAASLARNSAKKAEAERAAVPRWHMLGTADLIATSQRMLAVGSGGQNESFWYAQTSPVELTTSAGGMPGVQFEGAGHPVLRFDAAWAPMLYVFVHYIVDRQAPAVPLPAGLLERAQQQGRIS